MLEHQVTSITLELLHMDLMGPMQVESLGGKRYALVVVHDFSRYTWVNFIREKSDTFDIFKTLSTQVQREKNCGIVRIRSDHGREFEPSLMQTIYKQDRSQKHYLKLFAKGEKYKFLGLIPTDRHLIGTDDSGQLYFLGTDINGRDVFSRLLFGGRISMTVGFLSLHSSYRVAEVPFLI